MLALGSREVGESRVDLREEKMKKLGWLGPSCRGRRRTVCLLRYALGREGACMPSLPEDPGRVGAFGSTRS